MREAISTDAVNRVLSQVIDPELGLNIVDMGLIYDIQVDEEAGRIKVCMTMTTPACPVGSLIADEAGDVLRRNWPKLHDVEVELVWDPPWSTDRLSETAKRQLGWSD